MDYPVLLLAPSFRPSTSPSPASGGRKRLKTRFHKLSELRFTLLSRANEPLSCKENEGHDTGLFFLLPLEYRRVIFEIGRAVRFTARHCVSRRGGEEYPLSTQVRRLNKIESGFEEGSVV